MISFITYNGSSETMNITSSMGKESLDIYDINIIKYIHNSSNKVLQRAILMDNIVYFKYKDQLTE